MADEQIEAQRAARAAARATVEANRSRGGVAAVLAPLVAVGIAVLTAVMLYMVDSPPASSPIVVAPAPVPASARVPDAVASSGSGRCRG